MESGGRELKNHREESMKTRFHYYIERLTGLDWEPNRPLKLYWERLPDTARTEAMKRFLWALGLPTTTEEELEKLWQEVKNSTVIFQTFEE
jgi:hypothetical protein